MNTVYALPPDRTMTRLTPLSVLAQTAVFCTVIAVILWQFVPSVGQYGFLSSFVHSQAIGLSTAMMGMGSSIGLKRVGITSRLLRLLVMGLVTLAGLYIGMLIAAQILGIPSSAGAYLFTDNTVLVSAVTALVAGTVINWHFYSQQKLLELELAASEQARQADQARHAMLRAQLEPHMLFNTLANLRALISTDTDRALDMLDRLDSFLRETLHSSRSQRHSLAHEFRVLEDYLMLVQVRFGDRLTYTLSLPTDCESTEVPSLILQPLVENAIRHGIEPALDGGHVTVSAKSDSKCIVLTVADTGVGMASLPQTPAGKSQTENQFTQNGFGVTSVRERLKQHFGGNAVLELVPTDHGTTLAVTIPNPGGTA